MLQANDEGGVLLKKGLYFYQVLAPKLVLLLVMPSLLNERIFALKIIDHEAI